MVEQKPRRGETPVRGAPCDVVWCGMVYACVGYILYVLVSIHVHGDTCIVCCVWYCECSVRCHTSVLSHDMHQRLGSVGRLNLMTT